QDGLGTYAAFIARILGCFVNGFLVQKRPPVVVVLNEILASRNWVTCRECGRVCFQRWATWLKSAEPLAIIPGPGAVRPTAAIAPPVRRCGRRRRIRHTQLASVQRSHRSDSRRRSPQTNRRV